MVLLRFWLFGCGISVSVFMLTWLQCYFWRLAFTFVSVFYLLVVMHTWLICIGFDRIVVWFDAVLDRW